MVDQWIYPVFDILFFPFFWLSPFWGLTLSSAVFGVLLLVLYAATSDQWAMAFYKNKIKRAQRSLIEGNYSASVFRSLFWNNLVMAKYGLVPAIVCIGAILLIIPWIGNRFGHRPPQVNEPVSVTVQSRSDWRLEPGRYLRVNVSKRNFSEGTTRLRVLAEKTGEREIKIKTPETETVAVPLRFNRSKPLWPVLTPPRWYHRILNPAERALPLNSQVQRVEIGYRDVFPSLAFTFPDGSPCPGWLSWFFIVGFASGLWIKLKWEIE